VVTVVGGAEESGDGAAKQEESSSEASSDAFTPVAAYGGLGIGALALVVALLSERKT
jgi:hypothetical protein